MHVKHMKRHRRPNVIGESELPVSYMCGGGGGGVHTEACVCVCG